MLHGAGGRHLASRDWAPLLHDLARRAPLALSAWLRRELRDEHARRRLLRSLRPSARQRLWRWLAAPATVAAVYGGLRKALAYSAQNGPLLELQLQEAMLAQWLAQPPQHATSALVQGSLQALAEARGHPYAAVLQTVALGVQGDGQLAAMLPRLRLPQTAQRAAPVALTDTSSLIDATSEVASAQRLRRWLLHGVDNGPSETLPPEWLLALPAGLMLQGLREVGAPAAARLMRMPDAWRRSVMRRLAGVAAADLTALQQRLVALAVRLDTDVSMAGHIAEQALLATLLDGRYDGAALHAALAEALALQLPRDYDEVMAALEAAATDEADRVVDAATTPASIAAAAIDGAATAIDVGGTTIDVATPAIKVATTSINVVTPSIDAAAIAIDVGADPGVAAARFAAIPDGAAAALLAWLEAWRHGRPVDPEGAWTVGLDRLPSFAAAQAALTRLPRPTTAPHRGWLDAPSISAAALFKWRTVSGHAVPSWHPPAPRAMNLARPLWLDAVARTAPAGPAAERVQLLHWLGTGHWPWWADDHSTPAMLLRRQLAHAGAGAELRTAFMQLGDADGAVRRLQRHLPAALLETLLLQLSPDLGGFIISWLKAGAMLAGAPVWSLHQRRRSATVHLQVALGIVLRGTGTPLSATSFMDEAARRSAVQLGMALPHYRAALHAMAAQAAPAQPRYAVLLELLHGHGGASVPAPIPASVPAEPSMIAPAPAERALTRWLRYSIGLTATELTALHGAGQALIVAPASTALRRRWRRLLSDAAAAPLERARLGSLPPAALRRLLPLLLPAPQCDEIRALLTALAYTLPTAQRRRADSIVWETLFDQWHRQRAQRWSLARFLVALAQRLHSRLGLQPVRLLNGVTAALRQQGEVHGERILRSVAVAAQELVAATLPARAPLPRAAAIDRQRPQAGDDLPVGNAGLVLLHPFLSPYFNMLGLLKDGDFIDNVARSRAVYLLHFLASGSHDVPEYELALNKLLCGMPFAESPVLVDAPDENAIRLGHDLLHMVTQRWDKLNHTSVAGLRETFLMREGRLATDEGKTTLTVTRKTVDILKQSFPWQHAIIKLPWLSTAVFVNWS